MPAATNMRVLDPPSGGISFSAAASPRSQAGQPVFRFSGRYRAARGAACPRGRACGRRDEMRTCVGVTGLRDTLRMEVETGELTCEEVDEPGRVEVEELSCVEVEALVPDALGAGAGCTWAEPLCGAGGASGFGLACARPAANAVRTSAQQRTNSRPTIIRLALRTRVSPLVGEPDPNAAQSPKPRSPRLPRGRPRCRSPPGRRS